MKRRRGERAFSLARGVRIGGTNLTCDALGGGEMMGFLAHAQALGAVADPTPLPGPPPRKGTGPGWVAGAGRHELLATDGTLALLGPLGARLRPHVLPAPYGRPFALGDTRVELFPSGYLPGAASLLVEVGGRRLVYAGSVRTEAPAFGAVAAEVRAADALCIDGTFGDPRFDLPPPGEALARLLAFVEETLGAGGTPVLLVPPFSTAMDVAAALAGAGLGLRGHRAILAAAAAFRAAGASPPAIGRFDGRLPPGDVLLWAPAPGGVQLAGGTLGKLPRPRVAFVSGFSVDPEALATVGAEVGIPLSNQSGYAQLLGYIEASGAQEVAVFRGHAEELAGRLRERGLEAYALGPPRQMELFRG
jgi:putative mRNA 3-end processing factor